MLVAAECYRLRGFVNIYNLAGRIDACSLHVDSTVPRQSGFHSDMFGYIGLASDISIVVEGQIARRL